MFIFTHSVSFSRPTVTFVCKAVTIFSKAMTIFRKAVTNFRKPYAFLEQTWVHEVSQVHCFFAKVIDCLPPSNGFLPTRLLRNPTPLSTKGLRKRVGKDRIFSFLVKIY